MRRILWAAFAAVLLVAPERSWAQAGTPAQALTTCGSPVNAPVQGSYYSITMNTLSQLCTSASVSGAVTANQGTPAAQTLANAWPVMIPSATKVSTAALAANLVVSAVAASLVSFDVSADSTLSGAAWWVLVFDAATAPADGAVTPAKCYALPSGSASFSGAFPIPASFTTGIVIGVSTTGCFTKTASTHAFISGDYR
jgi:hypothetical protein